MRKGEIIDVPAGKTRAATLSKKKKGPGLVAAVKKQGHVLPSTLDQKQQRKDPTLLLVYVPVSYAVVFCTRPP